MCAVFKFKKLIFKPGKVVVAETAAAPSPRY